MRICQPAYDIFIDESLTAYFGSWLESRSYSSIFVLCDEHTEAYCYPVLMPFIPEHVCITIPSGESFKHITTCTAIWEELAGHHAERKSLMINLGGGVIGDMGGFAAATFKRGMDFIQIPTTLLAQVDASVGGKLGVDLNGMKNLIGVFKEPGAVFICTNFLQTLPAHQLRNGFAEVLKHGLIRDRNYWNTVRQLDPTTQTDWHDVIHRSVTIKSEVVTADPYEAGLRKILNFGHTIGHAVETWSLLHDETPLLHGEAIAIGMICEAHMSGQLLDMPATDLQDIVQTCMRYFEHYPLEKIPFSALMEVMQQDKKNTSNAIRFSLLRSIGDCAFDITADDAVIADAIQFYCGL